MDVANEAAAPSPEEPLPAPIAVVSSPVPAAADEAAAPPPDAPLPAPIPLDSPPTPAVASEVDAAALAFQPTPFRTVIARPFLAGLLGAGVGLWMGSAIQLFVRAYLIPRLEPAPAFFVPLLVALGVALFRGFRAPVHSYASLLGRIFGVLFFGGIIASLTVVIFAAFFDALHVSNEAAFVTIALAGAALAGLALARVHGIGADRSRRIKIGAGAAAVLFMIAWPVSPGVRCRLGFGEGCREAAAMLGAQGDFRASGTLGARGCTDGDAVACRVAGEAYRSDGPIRDLRRAADLYREGCALGDPSSCDSVHELELEQRCDRYGAFACVELARAHATGDGMSRNRALAQRYYRKACLLGADDACREAMGR